MSFPSVLQPGMLGGQNKWMPCLCFQSIFPSQNTPKTQQVSFLEKYRMCPVDCKLYKLFVACRLQIQGPKQADSRRRLSWSGQLICLQTGPTSSSGREEPLVIMTDGERLQGCRLRSLVQGAEWCWTPPPLALSLHGRTEILADCAETPQQGRRLVCQRSYITQRVSVWVPGCCSGSLSLQNEHCSAIDFIWSHVQAIAYITLKDKPGPVPPPQLKQRKLRMSWL